MARVAFEDVSKEFPGGTVALDRLNLSIDDGEFMILVGPSGCGKTTALRLLAGLEDPTRGRMVIGDRVVNGLPPRHRDVAMVFQNYALYPHLTVYNNLAFGLKQRRVARDEIDGRVREASRMLGLDALLHRRPAQLSGGQRQRVAMGRALVREPQAFLLDEPLSNLDAKLRVQMRAELKRIRQALGVTTIYVTHDQVEAMTLGDRIAVMTNGRVQQVGTAQDVYHRPANLFVAQFIGSPAMNLLRGTSAGGSISVGEMRVSAATVPPGDVLVGIRPESLRPIPPGAGVWALELLVEVVEPLGNETLVHGKVAAPPAPGPPGQGRTGNGDREALVVARLPGDLVPGVGSRLLLGAEPRDVFLFDSATGEAMGRAGAPTAQQVEGEVVLMPGQVAGGAA